MASPLPRALGAEGPSLGVRTVLRPQIIALDKVVRPWRLGRQIDCFRHSRPELHNSKPLRCTTIISFNRATA